MADPIKPGERLNITIENAKVINTGRDDLGRAFIEYTHGEYNTLATVDRDDPTVNVTRVAPAEWPPRPGDLWRDRDGDLWFCGQGYNGPDFVRPVDMGATSAPARVLKNFGPLTLVHREDERDGGAS